MKKLGLIGGKNIVFFAVAAVAAMLSLLIVFAVMPRVSEFVLAAEDSPIITEQPVGGEINYGSGSIELSTVASVNSGELKYVWYRVNSEEDEIVGEGQSYIVDKPNQSGDYYCRVTASDGKYTDTVTVTATVYKVRVDVEIDDKSVTYGEEEVPLTYTRKSALVGEDSDDLLGIILSREAGYNVGRYAVTGSYESDFYAVSFTDDGVYEVKKRQLTVNVASVTSAYGEEKKALSFELEEGSLLCYEDTEEDLNITLSVPNAVNAGRYPIAGNYDNENYEIKFRPATYIITPKYLDARITGIKELNYTGKVPSIGVELIGAEDNALSAVLTFNKAVKNAGDYIAHVKLNNLNYALYNNGEYAFSIKKAPLSVKVKDTVVNVGDAWDPEFEYEGFVNNEDAEVLTSLPVMDAISGSVGIYEATCSGAAALNYEITYGIGKVQINEKVLSNEQSKVQGSFMPGTGFSVTKEPTDTYQRFDTIILACYKIDIEGGNYGSYTAEFRDDGTVIPKLFLSARVVDENGVSHKIKNFDKTDNGYVFTSDAKGTFIVYIDWKPYAIALVLIILVILIIVGIRSKDRKRYKAAHSGHVVARHYADSVVPERTSDENE